MARLQAEIIKVNVYKAHVNAVPEVPEFGIEEQGIISEYLVTYASGATRSYLPDRAPKTVLAWLETHDENTGEPIEKVDAAADQDQELTETSEAKIEDHAEEITGRQIETGAADQTAEAIVEDHAEAVTDHPSELQRASGPEVLHVTQGPRELMNDLPNGKTGEEDQAGRPAEVTATAALQLAAFYMAEGLLSMAGAAVYTAIWFYKAVTILARIAAGGARAARIAWARYSPMIVSGAHSAATFTARRVSGIAQGMRRSWTAAAPVIASGAQAATAFTTRSSSRIAAGIIGAARRARGVLGGAIRNAARRGKQAAKNIRRRWSRSRSSISSWILETAARIAEAARSSWEFRRELVEAENIVAA